MLYEVITSGPPPLSCPCSGGGSIGLPGPVARGDRGHCQCTRQQQPWPCPLLHAAKKYPRRSFSADQRHLGRTLLPTGIQPKHPQTCPRRLGQNGSPRITSYNVCYTKLLRTLTNGSGAGSLRFSSFVLLAFNAPNPKTPNATRIIVTAN